MVESGGCEGVEGAGCDFFYNESLVTIQSADGKQNGQQGVAMSLCEDGDEDYSTLKHLRNCTLAL